MLPSSQRLSRQQVTDFLAEKAIKVLFNKVGTLKYLPGNTGFTVVTGSKQQKKAVLRNKLRRQLYTLWGKYPSNTSGQVPKNPIMAILYASKQSYEMPYADLKLYLYELLQKIGKNS